MYKSFLVIFLVCSSANAYIDSSENVIEGCQCQAVTEEFVTNTINNAVEKIQETLRLQAETMESFIKSQVQTMQSDQTSTTHATPEQCTLDNFVTNVLKAAVVPLKEDMHEMKMRLPHNCGLKSGYEYNTETGSCYKMYEDKATWYVANATCSDDGAYLAVINSDDELNILSDLSKSRSGEWESNYLWAFVGAYLDEDNIWQAVTGETVKEEAGGNYLWDTDFPKDDEEKIFGIVSRGYLRNINKKAVNYFICELPQL